MKGRNNMTNRLNKLTKQFGNLAKNTSDLIGTNEIPPSELFNQSFMLEHTNRKFSSFDDFVTAKFGHMVFKDIPDDKLNEWIKTSTDFNSWSGMQISAVKSYVTKKLGF